MYLNEHEKQIFDKLDELLILVREGKKYGDYYKSIENEIQLAFESMLLKVGIRIYEEFKQAQGKLN